MKTNYKRLEKEKELVQKFISDLVEDIQDKKYLAMKSYEHFLEDYRSRKEIENKNGN